MIQSIEICTHLSPAQLNKLENISIIRHYEPDEIIFYQGDASEYFHFLLQGDVSVYKSNNTETLEVHRFRAPSMIAEVATLKSLPFPASAETLSQNLTKLKKEKLISHQPHKYFKILNQMELEKYI